MLTNKTAEPDEHGRYLAPLRVPAVFDLDFMATALAIEHGNPPRKTDSGWTGRVGLRRAHEALVALAQRRISAGRNLQYEPDIPESVLDGWRTYIVERFDIFPPDALPDRLRS